MTNYHPASLDIDLTTGAIRGFIDEVGARAFLGIPFAQPPVGPLRGMVAQPPQPWQGVLNCTRFASKAVQQDFPPSVEDKTSVNGSEDCLYLNVWAAPLKASQPRPVILWLHGGAFVFGSGSDNLYTGGRFAVDHGVVFVTANYRLGGFGFFCNDKQAGSGNLGLLDQVVALKWIKENITAFDGDPNNVTLMGESAGAMSAGLLACMPAAEGLMHKVIIMSGGARPVFTGDEPRYVVEQALKHARVNDIEQFFALSTLDMNNAFSRVSLLSGNAILGGEAFKGCVDGVVFPSYPFATLRKIPMLIGHCKKEVGFFEWAKATTLLEGLPKCIARKSGEQVWSNVVKAYQATGGQYGSWQEDLFSDCFVGINSLRLADQLHTLGADVWVWRFDYHQACQQGPIHTSDIPFVFNASGKTFAVPVSEWGSEAHHLASMMNEMVITFVKCGKPHATGLPEWPQHSPDLAYMSFDIQPEVKQDYVGLERRQAWQDVPIDAV